MTRPVLTLAWWRDGEEELASAVATLTDEALDDASLLPGWTRRRLLAHLARNADALSNLLTVARTGVETPAYASERARRTGSCGLEAPGASEPQARATAAAGRLTEALNRMPDHAWSERVCTAKGQVVPAGAVPWLRCRETWVHAVDLNSGARFDDLPNDVAVALIDDVLQSWAERNEASAMTLTAVDGTGRLRRWGCGPLRVSGQLGDVTAWLMGRYSGGALESTGPLPVLSPWLCV